MIPKTQFSSPSKNATFVLHSAIGAFISFAAAVLTLLLLCCGTTTKKIQLTFSFFTSVPQNNATVVLRSRRRRGELFVFFSPSNICLAFRMFRKKACIHASTYTTSICACQKSHKKGFFSFYHRIISNSFASPLS